MKEQVSRRTQAGERAGQPLLVSTKLRVPPSRPNLVSRDRLLSLLSRAEPRRLVLISAPAGFGKTTLAASWARSNANRVAWISLDEGDNDPARFWSYFVAALTGIAVEPDEVAQTGLRSAGSGDIEPFLVSLINGIASSSIEFALVLDDYHLIHDPSIHKAMDYLLDHQPAQMQVVIASRQDPPLSLARLRARGQLLELRAPDLRFTPEEASAFLHGTMRLRLSPESITALESRTEGWIAALQMAALSIQGRPDVSRFVESFTGSQRYVLDYLAEEVFDQQPEEIRKFLLMTSILDRLSAPLCDAVIWEAGEKARSSPRQPASASPAHRSREMLASLEKGNLFLFPLDEEREWYRYHHLFAEFLRGLLGRTHGDLIPELHIRASEWLEAEDYLEEALEHALAAEDHPRAARLIERASEEVIKRGGLASLARWLGNLPEQYVRPNPRLSLAHAWALLGAGDFAGADARLADAEQAQSRTSEAQDVASGIAALRSFMATMQGDVSGAVTYSRQALEKMPAGNSFLPSLIALTDGFAREITGDAAAARLAYLEAAASGRSAGNIIATIGALAQLGDLQVIRGQLRYAAHLYRQALQAGTEERGWSLLYAAAHTGLGRVLLERNELAEAEYHLTRGLEQLAHWGSMGVFGNAMLAMSRQAWGDLEGATEALELAEQASGNLPPKIREVILAVEALLWLRRGELEKASAWARQVKWAPEEEFSSFTQYQGAALGRVLVAEGRAEEAVAVMSSIAEKAEAGGWWGAVIDSLAVLALAFDRLGQDETALNALRRALSLAEPEEYIRTFVQEGPAMFSLLSSLRARLEREASGSEPPVSLEYVDRLLAAFEGATAGDEVRPRSSDLRRLSPRTLSERETELLRLVAEGKPTREIAADLVIAEGTVKRHLHNIYGKLGATNRTQAIALARRHGLLKD